jgi:hypothetical protein
MQNPLPSAVICDDEVKAQARSKPSATIETTFPFSDDGRQAGVIFF